MRAYFISALMNIYRFYFWVSGNSTWMMDYMPCTGLEENNLCLDYEINTEFVTQIARPAVKVLCPAIIAGYSVILLAAIKWHYLMHVVIYVELTYIMILYMTPTPVTEEEFFYSDYL